jgi:hypothetical protein
VVSGEADVCLFLAVGADEGVDLGGLHVVELFDSVLGGFASAKAGEMRARRTLIWRLLDLMSTMKTRVLCSSIFFIADSVFRGLGVCYEVHGMGKGRGAHDTIVRNWSSRGAWGTLFRGYLGSRGRRRVLGRWKDTLKRSLRALCEWAPWSAAFFAALALLSFGDAFFGAEGFVALGVLVVAISLKAMSANDI